MLEGIFGNRTAEKVLLYLLQYEEGYASAIARTFEDVSLSMAQNQLERFEREQARLMDKLLLLDRNYHADTAEYRYVTRELNTLWRTTEDTLVDLRFEMLNAMTRDEWKAVFEN